jgi:glycosyltransferase involved in cell wall biosynthesis
MRRLSIVVPCYNEQEVLPETVTHLLAQIEYLVAAGKVSRTSNIWLVDDGSRDDTWSIIQQLSSHLDRVNGLKLSRNRGHQNALLAGLFAADGDMLVSIDADLQDDVSAIERMVDAHIAGADIVYGVRKRRDSDTFFKRSTARFFYALMRALGAESISDHADFRLMSRRAVESLKQFQEVNLFLRGVVPLIGYRTAVVLYDRGERFAGESKYPLRKMLAFALEGITSFSTVPLRMITFIGFGVSLATVLMGGWVLWVRFFTDDAIPGWTSTVLPLYFVGGVQILCLGVIGEYLGKLYIESKRRPRYFIDRAIGNGATGYASPTSKDRHEHVVSEQ